MIMILDDNHKSYTIIKRVGPGVGHGKADRTAARRKISRTAARVAAARATGPQQGHPPQGQSR